MNNNMKKVVICLVLAMMSVAGYAQSVVGKWVTEGGDSQVEIYQSGDKLNGKIVWLKKAIASSTSTIRIRSNKAVNLLVSTF